MSASYNTHLHEYLNCELIEYFEEPNVQIEVMNDFQPNLLNYSSIKSQYSQLLPKIPQLIND